VLIPFCLLAAWARFASPAPWEPEAMITLARQPGVFGDVSLAINTLGNLPVWAVVVGASAALIGAVRGVTAAVLVAVSFASDLVAFVVKILVERDRPETAAVEQFIGADSFSYPSGHTVRAAAFVAMAAWLLTPPRWRLRAAVVGGAIAGVVMGYARVSLGVHWPTDTLGGLLLGLGWFAFTAAVALRSLRSYVGRSNSRNRSARSADSPDSSWRKNT
jgi:undecaprenyl-diphosphatase